MKRLDKVFRSTEPVQAKELVGPQTDGDPIAMDLFKSATTVAPVENVPRSAQKHNTFDPHAQEFEYIPNATTSTTNTDYFNSLRQPLSDKILRTGAQFGANVVSSIGQGLANTFDMLSFGKTIKGELTGSDDNFQSHMFGLSTKDMQDWAQGIAERNKIYEKNPGSFDPTDVSWWANQTASAGTGIGMAIEALGTTVALESLTGGSGTAVALQKLGNLFSKTSKLNYLKEGLDIAKGLKSAATLYGTISRYSESRMEAQQDYDAIYDDLSKQKNTDGSDKFTEQEKKYLSSEGARRDFNINLMLLPLDILAFRTMVYNPISGGAGEGLVERLLGKIGNKYLRTGAQYLTEAGLEGTEEGFQFVGQEEGKHYAQVLGGMKDGSSFMQRFGHDVGQDEFWNNFAGGVIGSPVIGGAMKIANKAMQGNRAARLNEVHQDYVKNVGKMDNAISTAIKGLQEKGETKKAEIARRQFAANKALSALHLDALSDKDTAFDSHLNFLNATIAELK
jgi:hypothetical protein